MCYIIEGVETCAATIADAGDGTAVVDHLKFNLKHETIDMYSEMGIYDVSLHTQLVDYPAIESTPAWQIHIHYPCANLLDDFPNGVYLGYIPDMRIY